MEKKNSLYAGVGVATGYAARQFSRKILEKPLKTYTKVLNNHIKYDKDIADCAFNMYEKSSLKDKGIFLLDLNESNIEQVKKELFSKVKPKNGLRIKILELINKILGKNKYTFNDLLKMIANGENACHLKTFSTVLVNKDKLGAVTFHELGHALNHKGRGLGKFLSKIKNPPLDYLVPAILCTGLIKNKKEGKPVNKFDKVTTFIKNNCGILTAGCFIPLIAEEGLASVKGIKLAKKGLDAANLKHLKTVYFGSFSGYILSALLSGFASAIAVWVRDKMVAGCMADSKKEKNQVSESYPKDFKVDNFLRQSFSTFTLNSK